MGKNHLLFKNNLPFIATLYECNNNEIVCVKQ